MAKLEGQTIAASFDQVLIVDHADGISASLQAVESADTDGASSALKIATNKVEVIPASDDANAFEVSNAAGAPQLTVATDTPALTVGVDGTGADVIFYSGTAGDNFTWDASEEKLTITGTDGQTALDIADGNLVVADNVDIEGDIDVNGTANLDNTDIDGTFTQDAGNVVFNEDSGDYDFRVESDTGTHAIFVDAGTPEVVINDDQIDMDFRVGGNSVSNIFRTSAGAQTVGILCDVPATTLDITSATDTFLTITAQSSAHSSGINFNNKTDGILAANAQGGITFDHNPNYGSELLQFRAGNNGTHMTIDGTGNVGIGVIPETQDSTQTALQIGATGMFAHNSDGDDSVYVASNAYVNSSATDWQHTTSAPAAIYQQRAGKHYFYTAPTDSADANVTLTTVMTITGSNVGIGTTAPVGLLHLKAASPDIRLEDSDVGGLYHRFIGGGNKGLEIGADMGNVLGDAYIRFDVGNDGHAGCAGSPL